MVAPKLQFHLQKQAHVWGRTNIDFPPAPGHAFSESSLMLSDRRFKISKQAPSKNCHSSCKPKLCSKSDSSLAHCIVSSFDYETKGNKTDRA